MKKDRNWDHRERPRLESWSCWRWFLAKILRPEWSFWPAKLLFAGVFAICNTEPSVRRRGTLPFLRLHLLFATMALEFPHLLAWLEFSEVAFGGPHGRPFFCFTATVTDGLRWEKPLPQGLRPKPLTRGRCVGKAS